MQITSVKGWEAINSCVTSSPGQSNGDLNLYVKSLNTPTQTILDESWKRIRGLHWTSCSSSTLCLKRTTYKSVRRHAAHSPSIRQGHAIVRSSGNRFHLVWQSSCMASAYQSLCRYRSCYFGFHFNEEESISIKAACLRGRAGVAKRVASFMQGNFIETDRLSPSIRDGAMKAIDERGQRVTVGDVATRAGLKISQAEKALQALAADSGGFLEVSDEGDVLYVFPKDYRSNLAAKSFRLKIEPLLNRIQGITEYLVRASFGTALLASIALVYSAILILLSSSRSGDDNRNSRSGGFSSNQRPYGSGFTFFISPSDLFWYLDPYFFQRQRARPAGLNFFESIFSFVFGDGDPNDGLADLRWKLIGDKIAAEGGIVSAEELAPLLDPPTLKESAKEDESYVLPVLVRFDGQPIVDDEGNILYSFPSLQRTSGNWAGDKRQSNEQRALIEKHWSFRLKFFSAFSCDFVNGWESHSE
ncbi:hypothetical protein O6H91_11G036900 [Diphasiastrum complanatum]|uniref:Uncharacterized protein n=1 Tax=Diphasiastrum complanatum TaxID=34168 RepID=A0ACC2C7X0_DIPCM|nr:hypothetical protein O6H91_11G036900 [Diphasiastrum complanatum]